jgi:hypothetical protein
MASTSMDTTATISEQIQMITALKDSDPKLQKAYDAFIAGKFDEATALMLDSDFYKNNNQLARTRQTAKKAQPGVYEKDLNAYVLSSKKRLVAAGVKWTAGIEAQAKNAYNNGMTDNALDDIIVKSTQTGKLGGAIGGDIYSLKGYATSFGVNSLFNDAYWDSKSKGLFAGDTTLEDIQSEIRLLSASAFPAYAANITSGVPLDASTSAIKQSVATLLEIDPESVTYDMPLFKRLIGGEKQIPIYEAQKIIKSTPEWDKTNNARDSIDSMSYTVLKNWGLI